MSCPLKAERLLPEISLGGIVAEWQMLYHLSITRIHAYVICAVRMNTCLTHNYLLVKHLHTSVGPCVRHLQAGGTEQELTYLLPATDTKPKGFKNKLQA